MKKHHEDHDDLSEPLEDKTAALTLRSKKTGRLAKKAEKKLTKHLQRHDSPVTLLSHPPELLSDILSYLRPSDLFSTSLVCRSLLLTVFSNDSAIAREIISRRYAYLSQSLPLPVLASSLESETHSALSNPRRTELLQIHKKPYTHIPPPDPGTICTCLTLVDFAQWQGHLDRGEPLPIIPRGRNPEWNCELVDQTRRKVLLALRSPLHYARILEAHLDSTVRSIRRHGQNTGNRRKRFVMTSADAGSGTDVFLQGMGPPSLEFPFHRDEYYLLEAYMPGRWWRKERGGWVYYLKGQHERDVEMAKSWLVGNKN
ncbi:hypothetical protein GQ43DRAFT_452957 [Delitschia confertaspora ATCC 74209]|uniref:F-box domain-containing protein n=1 Tax=Delitschia confertaspora ATCC 74209 TaxID=1513339 RepID=A0A9P4JWK4_9PLEO|nr:hypothetical protein GQ43DRAFT_452957 [Delitschia confertaspora ATCC 74209]